MCFIGELNAYNILNQLSTLVEFINIQKQRYKY